MGRLDGKVAVITGGASGIGAATAQLFIEEGAAVVIGDMQAEVGEETAGRLGDRCAFLTCDVSKEDQVAALVAEATNRFGRLDCIYNNAGFGGAIGPIESISSEDFDLTFDVLLKGVFYGMKHAAPVMKAQESGSIISRAGRDASEARVQKMRDGGEHAQPMHRVGEALDIAKAALFLASDDSEWITGTAMVVDGGFRAGKPWRKQAGWLTEAHPIRLYRPEAR